MNEEGHFEEGTTVQQVVATDPARGNGGKKALGLLFLGKPVLLVGVSGVALSFYAFNVVAQMGLAGVLSGTMLFALMLAARGVVFGAFMPARQGPYWKSDTSAWTTACNRTGLA